MRIPTLMTGLARAAALATLAVGGASGLHAQELRDAVLRLETSVGVYRGNLRAVNAPLSDSAEQAVAVASEVGARWTLDLIRSDRRGLSLFANGDLRQISAYGFVTRDYAPTEWSGRSEASYWQQIGRSVLSFNLGVDGRSIWDRPPMPLFLQPGYLRSSGSTQISFRTQRDVTLSVRLDLQDANYGAPTYFSQLDLLDRREVGTEVSLTKNNGTTDGSMFRLHMRYDHSEYRRQESFYDDDPFRRDHSYRGGFLWQGNRGDIFLRGNIEGIANRSNTRRPEYNAVLIEAYVQLPLPGEYSLQALAKLADKTYTHDTGFTRLVPGEEADNRSEVWLGVSRQVAQSLDARLQLEWARAETDFSGDYFSSFGISIALDYRPPW